MKKRNEYNDLEVLTGMDNFLSKLCFNINSVAEIIVGLSVLMITVIFLWEIFVRFLNIGSLRWALETNRLLFITTTFIGSTVAYYRSRHIRFQYFESKIQIKSVKKVLSFLSTFAVMAFGIILLKEGIGSIKTQLDVILPALRISRAWLFVPLPICGFILVLHSLQNTVKELLKNKTIHCSV